MTGQSFILATGAITVPGAFHGASPETLTELGVSRVMMLTSTYDHRVIQGAESGQFLDWMHRCCSARSEFYDERLQVAEGAVPAGARTRSTAGRRSAQQLARGREPRARRRA
jgi:hypothetical protein